MSVNRFRTRDGREIIASAVCDGGDQGCGGGLLLLMLQAMKRLDAGAVLEVRSTDPGVREDLPAWCRMTGNELLAAQEGELHNCYFLRKAERLVFLPPSIGNLTSVKKVAVSL